VKEKMMVKNVIWLNRANGVVGQLTINNNFQKRMNLENVKESEKNSISKI